MRQTWRARISCRRNALLNGALILPLILSVTLLAHGQPLQAQTHSRLFSETGKTVRGPFLQYWQTHGGLMQQGYPISEELQERSETDGKSYTVQYFERAVFELHPELPPGKNVLLSLLGNFEYKRKYPNGAPNQKASATKPLKFNETGRTLGGRFREYWEKNGGLAQQGYPISDEFQEKSELDGKTYVVQYFERAVFELHPENKPPYDVLLSQLGSFRYRARYASQPQQPVSEFMRTEGVLYIRSEYYQSQGLSIWKANQPGGGHFQELTTIYEWWLDAQNAYRFLRANTEMLENGLVQISADGSNGVDAWWEFNVSKKITTPQYHQGRYPSEEPMTFDRWIEGIGFPGPRLIEQVRAGEAQKVGEEDRAPWGKLLIISRTNPQSGLVGTSAVRAEKPHVRVESADVDKDGKKIQSLRLTNWEWFDTQQLGDDFWMKLPTLDVNDKR